MNYLLAFLKNIYGKGSNEHSGNFHLVSAAPAQPPPPPPPPAEPEEELVDPMNELRDECDKQRDIYRLLNEYKKCNKRVSSKEKTTETCEQELIDYVNKRDKCVAKTLFDKLL